MNYTDEDFERLYIRFKAEGLPRNLSMKEFCLRNNVPFGRFNKWWRDTRHRVVPVEIDGCPHTVSESDSSAIYESTRCHGDTDTGTPADYVSPPSSYPHVPVATASESEPALRIMADIRMSNGLHVSRRNMSYPELRAFVERLEVLC